MLINKVYKSNCLHILADKNKILRNSVQLIFADPPYNLSGNGLKTKGSKTGGDWSMINESWDKMRDSDFLSFTNERIKQSYSVLKENGSIFIACSYHNMGESIMCLKNNGFDIKNIITWNKSNAMPNMTRRVLTHTTEFVIWATKGKGWIFNYSILKDLNPDKKKDGTTKQMRDLWTMPLCQGKERLKDYASSKALHPTQKPEELLKRIILGFSNENDIILDPFAGSGTTPYVAQKYNRKFIAIEKEAKYVKAINNRLNTSSFKEESFLKDKAEDDTKVSFYI